MFKYPLFLLFFLSSALLSAEKISSEAFSPTWNEFREYITGEMREWKVPGLALAIIKEGKPLVVQGLGVRKWGTKAPVTEQSKFVLGSCTKIFTSLATLLLAERKALSLDQPIQSLLPGFFFFDPWVTQQMTARDLLVQRIGLETWQAEYLWKMGFSREEMLYRMRYIKPKHSFRYRFGYSNLSYLVLSELIAGLSDLSWEDFIETYLFAPLEMSSSEAIFPHFDLKENIAFPHILSQEQVVPVIYPSLDSAIPIGGISSTVRDLSLLLQCLLSEGVSPYGRFLQTDSIREMWTPQITIPPSDEKMYSLFPELQSSDSLNYGLGWFLHSYEGKEVVEHLGTIPGMSTLISLIPQEKLGIVLLANQDASLFLSAIKLRIFDYFLQLPFMDWSQKFLSQEREREQRKEKQEREIRESRNANRPPLLPLSSYAGQFEHRVYGPLSISHNHGDLQISLGKIPLEGFLEHWHYNTFRIRWKYPFLMRRASFLTFFQDEEGIIFKLSFSSLGSFKKKMNSK